MNKRSWMLAAAGAMALVACAAAVPARASEAPGYRVSVEQLQRTVGGRFPVRLRIPGFLEFSVQAPRLRLLPQINRLGTEMIVEASGPALHRSHTGALDVDFALRYEPGDRTIRAHRLRVHSLRLSGLPARSSELLEAYGPPLAQEALSEVILHRLRPQDLALADAMGLQPGSITVSPEGLVIGFVMKP